MGGNVIEVTSSSDWSKRHADATSAKKAVRRCCLIAERLQTIAEMVLNNRRTIVRVAPS